MLSVANGRACVFVLCLYLQQLPFAAKHASSWNAIWRAQHRRVAHGTCCTDHSNSHRRDQQCQSTAESNQADIYWCPFWNVDTVMRHSRQLWAC